MYDTSLFIRKKLIHPSFSGTRSSLATLSPPMPRLRITSFGYKVTVRVAVPPPILISSSPITVDGKCRVVAPFLSVFASVSELYFDRTISFQLPSICINGSYAVSALPLIDNFIPPSMKCLNILDISFSSSNRNSSKLAANRPSSSLSTRDQTTRVPDPFGSSSSRSAGTGT